MSVEFRQRTVSDVVRMLKRRKWIIVLPILTMTIAVGYVVQQLPSIYESRALLTVQPATISERLVTSYTDEDLAQRLDTINKEVLSRTSLEPMIKKYDLYLAERRAGMPMELIVQKMYSNITVDIERTDNEKVAAFSIKYRDRSPEAARNVVSELSDKYKRAQMESKTQMVKQTRDFVENNLLEKKKALDELESERLSIMTRNVDTLPSSAQGLIAQLSGLRSREETISKEKELLIMEKGRLNDGIQSLNSQIRLNDEMSERERQVAQKGAEEYKNSQAYAQLLEKRADAEAKLANLKLTLTDKNPKVIGARNELAKINNEINKLAKSQSVIASSLDEKSKINADSRRKSLEIEKQTKQNQIANIDQQIENKNADLRANAAQISQLESKINLIPNVQVVLEGINTRYQSAKSAYDEALKKRNEVNLDVERNNNAQGETIKIQDPANLPKSPVAPKRQLLTIFGMLLGLGIGIFLAALLELPRVLKIQNIEDAKHYTGLPILASVPPLLTPQEKIWKSRAYWLKVLGGFAAAIISIPVVVFILQLTRIFERAVS